MSKAFGIGKVEAQAVSNLQTGVAKATLVALKEVVSKRGLRGFMSPELLARGLFNVSYSSGQGSAESWVSVLTNREDGQLATCFQLPFPCSGTKHAAVVGARS